MARYVDAIDLPIPIEEAFDYLADFSRTAEWDPGVVDARRITRGHVRLGSRFEVTVSVLGQRLPLEYRITDYERPTRLVLSGGDASIRSVDEITFASRPGGTRITYEARLELVGIRRLADPLLQLLFQRIGRLAVRGLRERLAVPEPGKAARGRDSAPVTRNAAREKGARQSARNDGRNQPQTEGVG